MTCCRMVKEFEDFNVGDSWASDFQGFQQRGDSAVDGEEDELEAEYEKIWQANREEELRRQQSAVDAPYEFEQENPHLNDPQAFEKGMALFEKGDISEAILCFEAAVTANPGNSIAWQYLGQAQAENDKDDQASRALVQAIRADPENMVRY